MDSWRLLLRLLPQHLLLLRVELGVEGACGEGVLLHLLAGLHRGCELERGGEGGLALPILLHETKAGRLVVRRAGVRRVWRVGHRSGLHCSHRRINAVEGR